MNRKRPSAVVVPGKTRRRGEPLRDSVNKALDAAYAAHGMRRTGRLVAPDSFGRKF
jgi:hypothetical protein